MSALARGALLGLVVASAGVAAPARAQGDPCDGAACAGAGQCFSERGEAFCLCDEGFAADAMSCVAGAEPEDSTARRRPGLAERVVEIALAQEGMGRFGVGRTFDGYPHELFRYLAPNEWWCTDFVAWVYRAAGVPFTGGYEGGWLVPSNDAAAAWFARNGLWVARESDHWRTFEPRPGDFLRFTTLRGGHAAIVTHVDGDTLYTIEGNVENHVRRGRYERFREHAAIDGIGMVTLENAAPVVRTSEAIEAVFPDALTVAAVVEDDSPPADVEIAWGLASGPGEVAFSDPGGAESEVTFAAPGLYVLEVTVHDGEHTTAAELSVDVWEPDPVVPAPAAERPVGSCGVSRAPSAPGGPFALAFAALVGLCLARRRR